MKGNLSKHGTQKEFRKMSGQVVVEDFRRSAGVNLVTWIDIEKVPNTGRDSKGCWLHSQLDFVSQLSEIRTNIFMESQRKV